MRFVVYVVLFALLGCQSLTPVISPQPQGPLSILQGSTDETTTVINIIAPQNKNYDIRFYLDRSLLRTPDLLESSFPQSSSKVINIPLSGLHPGALYKMVISENNLIIDERTFTTLPKKLKTPSIAVISCTDDSLIDVQKQQWDLVLAQKPDLLFLIGDNVYVDNHSKRSQNNITDTDILERYFETRKNLDVFKWKHLKPIFATWDDHDFGRNNANETFEYKSQSQFIFQTFFPTLSTKSIVKGPGVSSAFTLEKNNFIFLDNRFFRSEKKSSSLKNVSSTETHFGKEQEKWLFSLLKKKKGVFWLISGDQFFGGYHPFESYQGDHPQSFKLFLDKIKSYKKPVLFISGDRHIAELMKIPKKYLGFTTFELTSSGLHTTMYPGSLEKTPNPNALFNKDGEYNFLILQPLEASRYKARAKSIFLGKDARLLHEEILNIQL